MAVNRDKVKKQMAESKSRSGKFRFLPKDTTTALRILEFEDDEGEVVFARLYAEHREANSSGGKALGICRSETFGEPCGFCRVNDKARESGEEWVYSTKRRYVVNAIDINDSSISVRKWMLPITAYDQIVEYVMDDEYADILEQKPGLPFGCKREGSGLETVYTCKPKREPWPVSAELMKQVSDPQDDFGDPGLAAQCESIGYKVEDLFDDAEIEEAEAESDKKKTGGKKAKKAEKKASKKTTSKKKSSKKGAGIEHEEPSIEVGSSVLFEDEEVEYSVASIDGDNIEIEDDNGDFYDATMDQLKLIPADGAEAGEDPEDESKPEENDDIEREIEVNSEVKYLDEEGLCTVKSIKGDDVVIEDSEGEQFDVSLGELVLADMPF